MFISRFSYNIAPSDRDRAVDLISEEFAAAQAQGLWPASLCHQPTEPALQFEGELASLDQLDSLCHRGSTVSRLIEYRVFPKAPPQVEILKIAPQQ